MASMLFGFMTTLACASCALAHSKHEQAPVEGPHKGLVSRFQSRICLLSVGDKYQFPGLAGPRAVPVQYLTIL